jgi:hypothetical protein
VGREETQEIDIAQVGKFGNSGTVIVVDPRKPGFLAGLRASAP